ncbi:hypothetical protein PoB_003215800 [Plakobranchus ocellatus]|uniref:Uncharacterized protein n=1 Tax=Plakobranchus ocellatus TaxID=259542 RepID=A0AAV4AGH5_9GAST|nr:hypothetical protein PoB_003215800 [Plakobranchus ocellatus]
MTEQQIHLRKIISSANPKSTFEVDTEETVVEKVLPEAKLHSEEESSEIRCSCQEPENKAKNGLVIELLSLSCQITELLNQQKYKS